MRIVDIDKLILLDSHIYYIKRYKGSVALLNDTSRVIRVDIQFAIEYKPMGEPTVSLEKLDLEECPEKLQLAIKTKILNMDKEGVFSSVVSVG